MTANDKAGMPEEIWACYSRGLIVASPHMTEADYDVKYIRADLCTAEREMLARAVLSLWEGTSGADRMMAPAAEKEAIALARKITEGK